VLAVMWTDRCFGWCWASLSRRSGFFVKYSFSPLLHGCTFTRLMVAARLDALGVSAVSRPPGDTDFLWIGSLANLGAVGEPPRAARLDQAASFTQNLKESAAGSFPPRHRADRRQRSLPSSTKRFARSLGSAGKKRSQRL